MQKLFSHSANARGQTIAFDIHRTFSGHILQMSGLRI
jgi:hypothetical protein